MRLPGSTGGLPAILSRVRKKMTMANGTQTHDSGEKKLAWKPRRNTTGVLPDAPVGEWEARVVKGKCKVTVTQKGDPRLLIPFKLEKAAEEENESFLGAEVVMSVIIFDEEDPERRRASNMMKGRLRNLCERLDIEFGDVYPEECSSPDDFKALFDAIEGGVCTIWTTHNKRTNESGEEQVDTEIKFSKPGGGASAAHADEEEAEDDAPRGKAAAKHGKTSKRR